MIMNKPSKGVIVYVGPMAFPNGGAAARRILGISKSLILAGYKVIVGSGQMPSNSTPECFDFDGITVHSLGERIAESKPTLLKHLVYIMMGRRTVEWLKSLKEKPIAIILYSGDTPYLLRLRPYCKKESIPIIYEACEWYDPNNMPGGRYAPYRFNFELAIRYLVPRIRNVITISSFLTDYYNSKHCHVVCIPPTLDTKLDDNIIPKNKKPLINIGYTGMPAKKDLFNNILEALLQVDPEGKRFRFRVAGISNSQLFSYPAFRKRKINTLPSLIVNYGIIEHSEAIKVIRDCDFSVLIRYNKRYANAGFPTKVVESMSLGTPVICNLTSDLNKYIYDGISGIVVKDESVNNLVISLERITTLSPNELDQMSITCKEIAQKHFDFRLYTNPLIQFLQGLKNL